MQFLFSFFTTVFLYDLLHYHRNKEGEQSEAHDQDERPLLVRPAIVTSGYDSRSGWSDSFGSHHCVARIGSLINQGGKNGRWRKRSIQLCLSLSGRDPHSADANGVFGPRLQSSSAKLDVGSIVNSFGLVFFLLCQLDSVLEVALSWHLFQGGPLHQASISVMLLTLGAALIGWGLA